MVSNYTKKHISTQEHAGEPLCPDWNSKPQPKYMDDPSSCGQSDCSRDDETYSSFILYDLFLLNINYFLLFVPFGRLSEWHLGHLARFGDLILIFIISESLTFAVINWVRKFLFHPSVVQTLKRCN
jgi:hypothetical protein